MRCIILSALLFCLLCENVRACSRSSVVQEDRDRVGTAIDDGKQHLQGKFKFKHMCFHRIKHLKCTHRYKCIQVFVNEHFS